MKLTCVTAVLNAIKSGNRANLIRCVRSVASLKTEHEHLIYDGGSTDGTVELLMELEGCGKMPHLRVVSEPDTGIYNALNKGIRDARGEWFYVLGCDDYIFDEEQLTAAIDAGECSGADMVASPVAVGDQNLQVRGICLHQEFSCMAYPHQGLLMKTTAIREFGGFNDRYRIAGDFDLTLRMLLGGVQVAYYHKAFSHYGTNGLSSEPTNTHCEYRTIKELLFGLSAAELDAMDLQKVLPSRVVLPLLFNRSSATRRAARYHLMRLFAKGIGLMTPQGIIIWNKK